MSFSSQVPDPSNSQEPGTISSEILKELNIDLEQTFQLIEQLLTLDSCISYQILPLGLKEECLILGMVNVEDAVSVDYILPMLKTSQYKYTVQGIDLKTYQSVISAYLYYTRNANQKSGNQSAREARPGQNPKSPRQPQDKPMESPNDRATLIVDTPEEELISAKPNKFCEAASANRQAEGVNPHALSPSSNPIPSLELQARHLLASSEFLATLSAKQLWQELLARVINAGIGRIYFERHQGHGRVFWSKNGVWQSSIEKLNLSLFHGVIDELKYLANLSSTPLEKVRKFEIERYYKQERILLRLKLGPGKFGEDGTLQILRGKALEFYQQKQMDELGEQALEMAQQLERKLRQMRARACINPSRPKALTALHEIQEKINQQLDFIG